MTPQAMTGLSKGMWELSLISGYVYNYRGTDAHSTKLQGMPGIFGGGIGATDGEAAAWIGEHVG